MFVCAASASAGSFYNEPLQAGWNVGTGQTNDHFVGDRDAAGDEIGLRAQLRHVASITPTFDGGVQDLYLAPPGVSSGNLAKWNFDYSLYVPGGLTGYSANLAITGLDGTTQNIALPTASDPSQDSTNLGFFGFSPSFYDPNKTGTYEFVLTLSNGVNTLSTEMDVKVVTPEPSTAVSGVLAVAVAGGYCWLRRRNGARSRRV